MGTRSFVMPAAGKNSEKLSASSYNLLPLLGFRARALKPMCSRSIIDLQRQNEKSASNPTSDLTTNGYVEVVPLTTRGAREISSAPFQGNWALIGSRETAS